MEKEKYYLEAKLEAFQESNVLLRTENGLEFLWPIRNLPEGLKIGDKVRLSVSSEKSAEEERKKIAKEVLNQLLRE